MERIRGNPDGKSDARTNDRRLDRVIIKAAAAAARRTGGRVIAGVTRRDGDDDAEVENSYNWSQRCVPNGLGHCLRTVTRLYRGHIPNNSRRVDKSAD